MYEHEFEAEEITIFDIQVCVTGKIAFGIEDTAVGLLPYGDTHYWHSGNGMQPIDEELTELTDIYISDQYEGKGKERKLVSYASEVNALPLLVEEKKLWGAIASAIDLDDAVDSAIESAKEDAELAKYGL